MTDNNNNISVFPVINKDKWILDIQILSMSIHLKVKETVE